VYNKSFIRILHIKCHRLLRSQQCHSSLTSLLTFSFKSDLLVHLTSGLSVAKMQQLINGAHTVNHTVGKLFPAVSLTVLNFCLIHLVLKVIY